MPSSRSIVGPGAVCRLLGRDALGGDVGGQLAQVGPGDLELLRLGRVELGSAGRDQRALHQVELCPGRQHVQPAPDTRSGAVRLASCAFEVIVRAVDDRHRAAADDLEHAAVA